jgi:hypothetical protein
LSGRVGLKQAVQNVSLRANDIEDGGVVHGLRARFARRNMSKVMFSSLMPQPFVNKSSEIT